MITSASFLISTTAALNMTRNFREFYLIAKGDYGGNSTFRFFSRHFGNTTGRDLINLISSHILRIIKLLHIRQTIKFICAVCARFISFCIL